MSDENTFRDWLVRLEQGTTQECLRACDHAVLELSPEEREQQVEALLRALSKRESRVHTGVLRALRQVWFPGAPGLREVAVFALNSEDPLARGAALDVLERMFLVARLADRDLVRTMLASAGQRAMGLCAHLGEALGEHDGPLLESELALIEALRWKLDAEQPLAVRQGAAEALGSLGPRAAGAALWLLESSGSEDVELALASLHAILLAAPEAPEADAAIARLLARRERDAIQGALEICLDRFQEGHRAAVQRAVLPSTLRPLLGQLWPASIRSVACRLLGELGDQGDEELLLAAYSSAAWPERVAVWDALCSLARRGGLKLPRAVQLYGSSVLSERLLALALFGAMTSVNPDARAWLFKIALEAKDASLRAGAFALLAEIATEDERRAIGAEMKQEARAIRRRRVMELLAKIRPLPEQIPLLCRALHDPDGVVRVWACHGFGALGGALLAGGQGHLMEPVYPLLLRRLVDAKTQAAARLVLLTLNPTPPPGFPLAKLLEESPDWWAAYREVFCRGALSGDWNDVFLCRTRWSEKLLKQPHQPLPEGACRAGEAVVTLGALRVARRNRRSPPKPLLPFQNQEIAWLLALVWKRRHNSG